MDINIVEEYEKYLNGLIDELTKKLMEVLTDGAHVITVYDDNGNKEAYLEFHDEHAEDIFLKLISDAANGNQSAERVIELFKAVLFKKAETM